MLLGTRSVYHQPEGLRHEWVAVLILKHIKTWLLPAVGGSEIDFSIAEWAVAVITPRTITKARRGPARPVRGPPFVSTRIRNRRAGTTAFRSSGGNDENTVCKSEQHTRE
jgi:hypothetical protein